MTPSLILEQVAQQFNLWHESRKNKFTPIPINLKKLVTQLLPYYSKKEIAASLKIGKPSVDSIERACFPASSKSTISTPSQFQEKNLDFIKFNLAEASVTASKVISAAPGDITYTCEIIKPNGCKLIIHTNSDLTSIVNSFLCSS